MPAIQASTSLAFGKLLRQHRTHRGWSQEKLAHEAEVSPRHLSYLENARAAPSRTMALVLGSALDLPLRDRNTLLEAAGFVGAYRDAPLEAPEAAGLRRAIGLVLDHMEPNGAVALDRGWNVVRMNRGAARLLGAFCDLSAAPAEITRNIVLATLDPRGLRPSIVNFPEVAAYILDRSRREGLGEGGAHLDALRAALEGIPDLPRSAPAPTAPGPFLPVHLRRGGLEARLFTILSTIGTPIDATAEEIRIETYFPADEATARLVADLARDAS